MADPDPHITPTVEHGSKRHAPDRAGNLWLVILSPPVLAWTLYSFWRLADKAKYREHSFGRSVRRRIFPPDPYPERHARLASALCRLAGN